MCPRLAIMTHGGKGTNWFHMNASQRFSCCSSLIISFGFWQRTHREQNSIFFGLFGVFCPMNQVALKSSNHIPWLFLNGLDFINPHHLIPQISNHTVVEISVFHGLKSSSGHKETKILCPTTYFDYILKYGYHGTTELTSPWHSFHTEESRWLVSLHMEGNTHNSGERWKRQEEFFRAGIKAATS